MPAITDGDFNIFESHTILRYLATTKNCEDSWHPKDPQVRAKVDEYLEWHHNKIRLGAGGFFFRTYMAPLTGKPAPKEGIKESWDLIHKSMSSIEQYWMIQADKSGLCLGAN